MCLLLFKHEIHLGVLRPDRKQCSLMFRVKIKESLFYVCAREKKICNSLFANYALFFFTLEVDKSPFSIWRENLWSRRQKCPVQSWFPLDESECEVHIFRHHLASYRRML